MAQQRLNELSREFQSVLDNYKVSKQVGKAWESIVSVLAKEPLLCFTQQVHYSQVGVTKENRAGTGFSIATAMSNGVKHMKAGYSLKKANEGAWGVLSSGMQTEEMAEAIEFNNQCSSRAGLPNLADLKVTSFGGTHANVWLRAVAAKLPCADPEVGFRGMLHGEVLCGDHEFQEAFKNGLTWRVLNPVVVRSFPEVLEIGAKALNVRGHQETSELEGLLALSAAFAAAKRCDLPDDLSWNYAQEEALKAEPFWSDWVNPMRMLCEKLSASQFQEVSAMRQKCVRLPQGVSSNWGHLGGAYISKVATLNWNSGLFPRVRAACLTANLLIPVTKVVDGKCALLSTSDLAKLTHKDNMENVELIERLMNHARDICDAVHSRHDGAMIETLAHLDCRCVWHVTKKGSASGDEKEFRTIAAIADEFLKALRETTKRRIADPFAYLRPADQSSQSEPVPKGKAKGKCKGKSKHRHQIAEPESPTAELNPTSLEVLQSRALQLHLKGFKQQALVSLRKAPHSVWAISKLDDDVVVLSPTGMFSHMDDVQMSLSEFTRDYALSSSRPQKVLDIARMLPNASVCEIENMKALIAAAIQLAWSKHDHMQGPGNYDAFDNPSAIRMAREYDVGEFTLVPMTKGIFARAGELKNRRDIDLGRLLPNVDVNFHISSSNMFGEKPFFVPFWAVPQAKESGSSSQDLEVNMTIEDTVVDVQVGNMSYQIPVPIMTNVKRLVLGCLLKCSKIPHENKVQKRKGTEYPITSRGKKVKT